VARTKDVDGEVRKKPWLYSLNKYGRRKLKYFKRGQNKIIKCDLSHLQEGAKSA
jgi:hypothetical protein